MNRRKFLKNVSIVAGTTLASTFLPGCAGSKVISPVVVKKVAKTAGMWFAEYLFNLALDESFQGISDFISSLDKKTAQHVESINDGMRGNGFDQFDGKKVFGQRGVYTYEIGHHDNFNSCATFFFSNQKTTPLVEGPTIIGLAMAAEDYRNNGKTAEETSLALLPQDEFQRPTQGDAFGETFNRPYVALTSSGSVIIDYRYSNSQQGLVEVAVVNTDGEQRFEGSYTVTFS